MPGPVVVVLGAATVVAALGVTGCAGPDQSTSAPLTIGPPVAVTTPTISAAEEGPLPPPQALADVLARLADPAIAGPDKLPLVADTDPADAAAFDQFATALRDTGFAPITVTAADLRWSPARPGDVQATVQITATNPDNPGEFSFPMEFSRNGTGWQLTRETADMLLAFGNARAGAGPTPAPTSPPP